MRRGSIGCNRHGTPATGPARRAASARDASMICTSSASRAGNGSRHTAGMMPARRCILIGHPARLLVLIVPVVPLCPVITALEAALALSGAHARAAPGVDLCRCCGMRALPQANHSPGADSAQRTHPGHSEPGPRLLASTALKGAPERRATRRGGDWRALGLRDREYVRHG